ncbi:MAG TPA: hypothetical protein VG297_08500 [Bryobacteraceae bacterium]|nr:hypothetical protein [Bryobacteraceae bacterium]
MKRVRRGVLVLLSSLCIAIAARDPVPSVQEYPTALARERQTVVVGGIVVGGIKETWELRWKDPPKPACEPREDSLTCPCTGFAYGEGGDLWLVRMRGAKEIDRLDLTPLFAGAEINVGDIAVLPRWPTEENDFAASEKEGFAEIVARRPTVKVMDFADYDHDGRRTEFYLKTDTLPCGKNVGVVVGMSKSNPRLHVFGSVYKPNEPLVLQKHVWEALSRARGTVEVEDWPCGDHGAEQGTSVRIRATNKGIDAVRRTHECPVVPGQTPLAQEPI